MNRKPLGFLDLGAHLERLLSEEEPTEDSRGMHTHEYSYRHRETCKICGMSELFFMKFLIVHNSCLFEQHFPLCLFRYLWVIAYDCMCILISLPLWTRKGLVLLVKWLLLIKPWQANQTFSMFHQTFFYVWLLQPGWNAGRKAHSFCFKTVGLDRIFFMRMCW